MSGGDIRLADIYEAGPGWGIRMLCPLCENPGLHLVDVIRVEVGRYTNVRLVLDCESEHRFYLEFSAGKGQCFVHSSDDPESLWG